MKVTICSRSEIQKLLHSHFPENTAVVSFYGEDEPPVHFPPEIYHLRLYIDDVWYSEVEDPSSYHLDDFRKIARFVLSCEKKKMDIICQCHVGVSRSAGAAAAILEFFEHNGISIFADYHYTPNQMFYQILYRCLKEESSKDKEKCTTETEKPKED